MEVLGLIVTGGLAGWLAAILVRGAGYGLVINIIVGVIGSMLGGALLRLLGALQGGDIADDSSSLASLAIAVVGAALLLTLLNRFHRPE